jgi:hypothetical protein
MRCDNVTEQFFEICLRGFDYSIDWGRDRMDRRAVVMGKKFGGKFSPQDEHVSDIKVAIKTEAKKGNVKSVRPKRNRPDLGLICSIFRR